ncbi:ScbA/BarX family gamma-butyrolactone biosynthesis protein [Streptomyces sp. NPDC048142]|uniref:ScbA/BarX family gamma-butyrolactone biosynthesis protein n=1 Tax=Streptomyces sp. NPDC048142 TaxID=3365501 RepID=UPI003720B209
MHTSTMPSDQCLRSHGPEIETDRRTGTLTVRLNSHQTPGGALPRNSIAAPRALTVQRSPSHTTSSRSLSAYTHLTHEDSILVRRWRRGPADTFVLSVVWPPSQGRLPFPPNVLAQTIRQSGLVIAHAEYGVPLDHQTVLNTLDITADSEFRPPADRPAMLDVEVTVQRPQNRPSTPSALSMSFRISHEGAPVAGAASEFSWVSSAAYRRLRGTYLTVDWGAWPVPVPVAAELVGRAASEDVVLSPGDRPGRWLLRNDPANTALFDHPVDHVPGLVLLEAADQAARALLAPDFFAPGQFATRYSRYVEFDHPCWVEAALLPTPRPGRVAVRVTGVQRAEPVFTVDFEGRTV